jgi:small nuclear ribonucleoprotein (snRNP)-like protein
MRWEDLFADLEQQWQALAEGERHAEIVERTRAEFAQLTVVDRLRGSEEREVRVRTRGGQAVEGRLCRVGADFLLLALSRRECVLPLSAVSAVSGLGEASVPATAAGAVRARLGLASVLRRVAADRSQVSLVTGDGSVLNGTLQRVGSDFVEMAVHEPGEALAAARSRRRTLVPFAALEILRRDAAGSGL